MSKLRRPLFFAIVACATLLQTGFNSVSNSVSAQTLAVGSKAPALDIAHWISDGHGEFPHVSEFVPGKIYVVEFWATWCSPCIRAMPHLAELQERYADKIQFISVTNESLTEVSALLAEDYPGIGKTFGELTSAYCLTADPDGSTQRQYMEAAQVSGIPTAFVVGPTGEIEAIGHPVSLGSTLEKMANGSWDRDAYYAAKKKKEELVKAIEAAIDDQDIQKAFERSLELDAITEPNDLLKIKFMQTQLAIRIGDKQAQQFFIDTANHYKDQDSTIAAMAWMIVQMKYEGEDPAPAMIATAEKCLKQQIEKLQPENEDRRMMKGAVMDILSHIYYVQGRLDDAIANQQAAVKLNNDADLSDFLKKLLEEKK